MNTIVAFLPLTEDPIALQTSRSCSSSGMLSRNPRHLHALLSVDHLGLDAMVNNVPLSLSMCATLPTQYSTLRTPGHGSAAPPYRCADCLIKLLLTMLYQLLPDPPPKPHLYKRCLPPSSLLSLPLPALTTRTGRQL
jgi:hypothetical protein